MHHAGARRTLAPMTPMTRRRVVAAALILAGVPAAGILSRTGLGAGRALVGTVTRMGGTASVVVGAGSRPLASDSRLFVGDRVVTGADGRLEIGCVDGSTIVVGAETTVTITEFTTTADGHGKAALIDMVQGLLRI